MNTNDTPAAEAGKPSVAHDALRRLCVVMEKRQLDNRWSDHQWEAVAILPERDEAAPRLLRGDARMEQWLYPALALELHADEVDNYLLNLGAPEPRLFVVTRSGAERIEPFSLTVSYGEAARMLDAGETVDGIPLPTELWIWIGRFCEAHYQPPEPRREKRYARAPKVTELRS
ncbi:MAG TPA: DUF3305 domain-containing protein [Rhodocyclaceae bacterium]|nr:DUF3305 domain-containing protein [Rhodocyclaceae bacterium]